MIRFSRASCFSRRHRKAGVLACTTLAFGVATAGASPSRADSFDHKEAKFVSGTGTLLYVASSLVMPFLLHDEHATQHSLRTADANIAVGKRKAERLGQLGANAVLMSFPTGAMTMRSPRFAMRTTRCETSGACKTNLWSAIPANLSSILASLMAHPANC